MGDHGADRFRTGVVNGACHVAERAAGEDDVVHDDAIPPGDGSKKGGDLAGLILRGADLVADGNPGTEVGETTHVIPGEFGTAGIGGNEHGCVDGPGRCEPLDLGGEDGHGVEVVDRDVEETL